MAKHKNQLSHYLALNYRIEIERDEEGDFVATIPLLPGCISDGATPEQAAVRIQEAKTEWIAARIEANLPIPEPKTKYSGRWVLRTTPTLHRKVAECARHEDVSINHFVNGVLSEAVGQRHALATWSECCRFIFSCGPERIYVAFGNSAAGALFWQNAPAFQGQSNSVVKSQVLELPAELHA